MSIAWMSSDTPGLMNAVTDDGMVLQVQGPSSSGTFSWRVLERVGGTALKVGSDNSRDAARRAAESAARSLGAKFGAGANYAAAWKRDKSTGALVSGNVGSGYTIHVTDIGGQFRWSTWVGGKTDTGVSATEEQAKRDGEASVRGMGAQFSAAPFTTDAHIQAHGSQRREMASVATAMYRAAKFNIGDVVSARLVIPMMKKGAPEYSPKESDYVRVPSPAKVRILDVMTQRGGDARYKVEVLDSPGYEGVTGWVNENMLG